VVGLERHGDYWATTVFQDPLAITIILRHDMQVEPLTEDDDDDDDDEDEHER
jgi:hypothetical protein